MDTEDDFDAVWGRMTDPANAPDESTDPAGADGHMIDDPGPPLRVTILIEAEKVPVAPWAQGWRVGAAGPSEGHVTMLFEHDIDASPVSQLAAVTGLLGTISAAQLKLVWWAIQTRGRFPGEPTTTPT